MRARSGRVYLSAIPVITGKSYTFRRSSVRVVLPQQCVPQSPNLNATYFHLCSNVWILPPGFAPGFPDSKSEVIDCYTTGVLVRPRRDLNARYHLRRVVVYPGYPTRTYTAGESRTRSFWYLLDVRMEARYATTDTPTVLIYDLLL